MRRSADRPSYCRRPCLGLKRNTLIDAFRKGLGSDEPWSSCISAYPLVTIAAVQSVDEYPICLRESLAREVAVRRIGDLSEAHAAVLEAASKGAAVALIRNTVDEAVASYTELASACDGETLLFHARFAMADRLAIEEKVWENSAVRRNPTAWHSHRDASD